MGKDEQVRQTLMESAAACLDHIRSVKWGTATAEYGTIDQGFQIHVSIRVSCYTAKKEPEADAAP
jgi:hypothetical protein